MCQVEVDEFKIKMASVWGGVLVAGGSAEENIAKASDGGAQVRGEGGCMEGGLGTFGREMQG